MKRSPSIFRFSVLALCFAAMVMKPAPAAAAIFRQAVVVIRPAGVTGRAGEMAVDSFAQKALAERYIADRMSPVLLELRGDLVKTLLEPAGMLLEKFTVINREDVDASHVRVTCEADIDTAAVILRLVNGKVLTFGAAPPRVLFMAAAGTAPEMLQALRGRVTDTLGSAGIVLLAPAAPPAGSVQIQGSPTAAQIEVMTRSAAESRADLIASVSFSANAIPSGVGGVILDATVQYTLIRPRDNAIVAEQVFTARGSGASKDLAQRSVMDELGPQIARGMAGRLGEAIFAEGSVVDPAARLSNSVTVNVFARPDAASTKALMDLLRDKQLNVSLGDSSLAMPPGLSSLNRPPADRMIVSGQVTVTQLFDTLTSTHFGDRNALQASVVEYGDNYIGIEILDKNKPTIPPVTTPPPPPKPQTMQASTPRPAAPAPAAGVSVKVAIPPPLEFVKVQWARTAG